MPFEPPTHFNPPGDVKVGRVQCGIKFEHVKKWTNNPDNTTCLRCLDSLNRSK